MNARTLIPFALLSSALAIACGGSHDPLTAELDLPGKREAKITVTPALDVSSLFDADLADRIVLEEITINLAEVRLLGADPTIPVGGYQLLGEDRIVRADEAGRAALELPFPEQYLGDDDLAVYLRIDRSERLEMSSLVIRGRLYAAALTGGSSALTSVEGVDGATDPDIDPADDPESDIDCATDPDIDPADCGKLRRGLVNRASYNRFVEFELRDDGAADLVAELAGTSALDVVVGIPATRWFTPSVVDGLESALSDTRFGGVASRDIEKTTHDDRVVVEATNNDRPSRNAQACKDNLNGSGGCQDEVFLTDARDGLTVRR